MKVETIEDIVSYIMLMKHFVSGQHYKVAGIYYDVPDPDKVAAVLSDLWENKFIETESFYKKEADYWFTVAQEYALGQKVKVKEDEHQ